eukprot:SAG31_NODE_611_length_13558_cov_224.959730_18_plen_50_part_00
MGEESWMAVNFALTIADMRFFCRCTLALIVWSMDPSILSKSVGGLRLGT